MKASSLINLIPDTLFRSLAVETKVDNQVKQLSGELMFKLILFSMLNSDKLSLRVMEAFLQSAQFKSFSGYDIVLGKYNSIRDRICTVNAEYFEQLFQNIFSIYNKELREEKSICKVDSTYVSLATSLLLNGMRNGNDDGKRMVKFSVNLKGSLPYKVKVFTDQKHISENYALTELIDESNHVEGDIIVFDRGIQSRSSFESFTKENKSFIARSKTGIRFNTIEEKELPTKQVGSSVTVLNDEIGKLFNEKQRKTQHLYRVIRGIIDKTGEAICWITNIMNEDPYTIAQWYKQRWEIEVFFKFIKQHLNAKHLVSRDHNGIKVMLYMTMILATLIIVYKKLNGIKSFKIAKLKFELELENDIMKHVVILCGGDPSKAPHLFNSS